MWALISSLGVLTAILGVVSGVWYLLLVAIVVFGISQLGRTIASAEAQTFDLSEVGEGMDGMTPAGPSDC